MRQETVPLQPKPAPVEGTSALRGPNPEPFPYEDYLVAKRTITAALGESCFYASVTGKSGMGKTCLLKDSVAGLDRHKNHILYITSAHASVTGIARVIAMKLHVTPRRSFLENVQVLNDAIAAQPSHLVLWLDEADQMAPATMSELRMLAESNISCGQSFSVVLSGLPELKLLLDGPELFPLKRRITHRLTLTGLRRTELDPFLLHRFGDVDDARLPQGIKDELFERTQATPALLDQVVRQSLASSRNRQGVLDANYIRSILDSAGL